MTRSDLFCRFLQTLHIRTKNAAVVPLSMNEAQRLAWRNYLESPIRYRKPIRLLILKARQMGISTLIQSLMVSRLVWDQHINLKIIAHEGESTKNIWSMADRMISHSPFAAYARKVGHSMEVGHSALSCATAGSPHATRSMNITCLHLSEVAFWVHPDAWLAAMQTVPITGESWLFVESTANGKVGDGKLFYDEWQRAVEDDSTFTPLFLPWFALGEYDLPQYVYESEWKEGMPDDLTLSELDAEEEALREAFGLRAGQLAWRRLIIKEKCQGDVELFHQEYPSTADEAFVQSGLPFFSTAELHPFRRDIRKGRLFRLEENGRFVSDPNGYVEIWQAPEPGHQYVIGADTSMGFSDKDHSRSAAEIIDMETLEQVGEYDCPSAPHVMARHLAILGRRYNEALIAPEITSSGGGGGRELLVYLMKQHQYYHLHRWRHPDRVKTDPGTLYGWETNARTRPRMIARIREVISERACTIHSDVLLSQLGSFGENDDGRMEALAGHDDLLFAWGIALMSRSENYVPMVEDAKRHALMRADFDKYGIKVRPDPIQAQREEWNESGQGEQKELNWQAL